MKIYVTWCIGEGETKIIAFDKALYDAGIADYNLIKLTSIIPKKSEVIIKKLKTDPKKYGNKLYVVLSEQYETQKGKKAVAGLGWIVSKEGGIFVEYSNNREAVTRYIKKSLEHMASYRKMKEKIKTKIVEKICENKPVCVLVVAVYRLENGEK